MAEDRAYSVSELTGRVKNLLEGDSLLSNLWVEGEVSNLTAHSSGHVYFSLKDEGASLSCAMFRGVAQAYRNDMPRHGGKMQVRGRISVYPPRGNYQLIVSEIRKAGLGELHRRFLELKDKLEKEGLFEPERKRRLPRFPARIGLVTSPTGAVIRDILQTIERRFPHVVVWVAPAKVQGEGAAQSIVRALRGLEARCDLDAVILARGGGSLEDLWAFNEEIVARAIADCAVPVVTGIGHETDFTIADFTADRRASTPTAAAELLTPNAAELRAGLDEVERQLRNTLQGFIDFRRQLMDDYAHRLETRLRAGLQVRRHEVDLLAGKMEQSVLHFVDFNRQLMDNYAGRLKETMWFRYRTARAELESMEAQLASMDVQKVLERGYTLTLRDGKAVGSVEELKPGDRILTWFRDGQAESEILDTQKHKENEGNG